MADVDGDDLATSTPMETTPVVTDTPQPEATQAPSVTTAAPDTATPSPAFTKPAVATPGAPQRQAAPLAVGPSSIDTPHIYWTAAASDGQLVGGATFRLDRQICGIFGCHALNRVESTLVVDCAAADSSQCLGPDKHPGAGEFLVTGIETRDIYRLSQRAGAFEHGGRTYHAANTDTVNVPALNDGAATVSPFAQSWLRGTVNVNVADLRTSLKDDGHTSKYSKGARFGLFTTATATTPVSTCEITSTPATGAVCTFTVDNPSGSAYWVGPIAPTPGSQAAQFLTAPITTLVTGTSNAFTTRPYRYQTPGLSNGASVTVPSTTVTANSWNASSTRMVNRLRNPELQLSCSAGIKVALVMDLSGSIAVAGAQDTLKSAASGLVESLQGTNSSMALFSFGDASPRGGTRNLPDLRSLEDLTQRNQLLTEIENYWNNIRTDQGTNWDAGLLAASLRAGEYDLVLVLTDGNPTFSNSGLRNNSAHGSGSLTTFRELERAVLSANAIKAKDTRVMAVGIGVDTTTDGELAKMRHNLAAISGPRGFEPGLSLNEVDHTTAGWEQLGTILKQFARGLSCKADVVVEKRTGDTVASAQPTGGWKFSHQGTGSSDGIPRTERTTEPSGTTSWEISLSEPGQKKSVTLTQLSTDASWHLAALECSVNGKTVQVELAKTATIPGVGVGDTVKCVYTSVRTSSVQVAKQWVINGTSHAHGQQPDGYKATLTLTGPAPAGASAQEWGKARTGYRAGDKVVITETTELPAGLRGCTLESSLIKPAGSTGAGTDVRSGHTVTLAAGVNAWTITNTVSCTTLTLTKNLEHSFGGTSVIDDWLLTSTRGGTTTLHLSGVAVGVEPGEHVIGEKLREGRENLADGYEFTHVNCVANGRTILDGAPEAIDLKLTVPAGTNTVCVLTNTDKPGSVQWAKVDEMQRPLAGSVWELRGPDGDVVEVTETPAGDAPAASAGPGQFLVQDLAWGRYTLSESKAPSGYRLAEGTVEFTIGPHADGMSVAFDEPFENQPYPAVVLPLTGGTARDLYTTAGTALMGAALLVGLAVRRRTHSPTR